MLSKYGTEFWIQNIDNFIKLNKDLYKYKKYYIDNEYLFMQGYEDYVYFEKLLKKYNKEDIYVNDGDIFKEIGNIFYIINDKKHRYFPDFYIKKYNKIIEVKSEYTYNKNKNVNEVKKESCINNGFNFQFYIISKKEYSNWLKNKNKYDKI